MPRSTRVWDEVRYIGYIWQPGIGVCAQHQTLSKYDRENIGEPTRKNIEQWLTTHTGDFQNIIDFEADFGTDNVRVPWEKEDSEVAYDDAMFGSVDADAEA